MRDLTIFNTGESRNKSIILPGMTKVGIGAPRTIRKEIFMEFKWTIHPTNTMGVIWKRRGLNKPKKGRVPDSKGW